MVKKKIRAYTALILLAVMVLLEGKEVSLAEGDNKPQLLSESFVLMEASTGTVLHEKDMHKVLPPASITKIMTLLLVYEALEEGTITKETIVTTTEHAAGMGGSQVYLEPGEQQTVETLIKCICISSANDACVAMAEHLAGTEEAFVDEMNKKAKELGMNNTHFVNCCGLDVDGHVSTAYDIALMSAELMSRYPDIMTYTTRRLDTMIHTTNKGSSEFGLTNTNKLIYYYSGATGLKTGFTSKAMHCLAASAERSGTEFIAVVLGAPSSAARFESAKSLLDHAFAGYKLISVEESLSLPPIKISNGERDSLMPRIGTSPKLLVEKDVSDITTVPELPQELSAPIAEGQQIGTLKVYSGDSLINEMPLVAAENIGQLGLFEILCKILSSLTCF